MDATATTYRLRAVIIGFGNLPSCLVCQSLPTNRMFAETRRFGKDSRVWMQPWGGGR